MFPGKILNLSLGLLTFWLHINVFWVLFLTTLGHAESSRVRIYIVEHVSVLIASEPLILPIKSQWLIPSKETVQVVIIFKTATVNVLIWVAFVVKGHFLVLVNQVLLVIPLVRRLLLLTISDLLGDWLGRRLGLILLLGQLLE